ncbi:uncharacterized protein MELLADRAFT_71885 [Melampsora larici-populina 98AG31]|uniref:Uncharacterized protein n=1 Tax=Melampsora larici-populina (strain 98AG31 / pathotype 3-4-7) TaxID=747676 RepID=F4RLS9_MELLP|nr:uncharacterized protein MELLADRAFT_71885 [Melampsora larici-populina 98AG31]EGG06591.1 hypothetical protein MELLADRAFT_71885 [Melampsora larici-populina 98AG31]
MIIASDRRNNYRKVDLNLIPNQLEFIELDHQDVKLWDEILSKFNSNPTWLPGLQRFKFNKSDWDRESIIKTSLDFNSVTHLSP